MAASAFEVAAVFALKDEATAVLRRMAKEVETFTKLVNDAKEALTRLSQTQFTGLGNRLKGLTDQAELTQKAFTGAFSAIDRAASGAILQINSLASAMAAVNAQAAAMRVPGAAAAAGGVGRGRGYSAKSFGGGNIGGSIYTPSIPIPGAHAHIYGHGPALAAGGALAYGIYEEGQIEDSIAQMLFHSSQAPTQENKQRFREIIQNTAALTGYGYHDIGEAATDAIRLMRGAPNNGLDILPELLKGAATESRLKGTDFKAAMKSIVELTHMTKEYDPEQIKQFMPFFSFMSIANPATPEQMVRAASYAMPTLQSMLNMDPADVLLASTAIARAGATNTKAGTWVRAGFERALPPDARVVGEKEYDRRMTAMEALGLVDRNGKSTVLDASGQHLDIEKLLSIVDMKSKTMSLEEKNAFMKKVFGEQGERGIALLMSPAVRQQTEIMKKEYPDFKNQYANFWDFYTKESPVQKTRQAWQDLTNVLADIGQTVLPPLVGALQSFDSVLKTIHDHLPKQGEFGGSPAKGSHGDALGMGMGAGAVAGALAGGTYGALGGSILGPFGTATGALGGAAAGAMWGAFGGGAINLGLWLFGLGDAAEKTGDKAAKAADGVNQLNNALTGFAKSWGSVPSQNNGGATLQPQSFRGEGASPRLLQNIDWRQPQQQAQPIYVPIKIDMDGRTVAEVLSSNLAAIMAFPTQAPFPDGRQAWLPPDGQVVTT